MTAFVHLSNNAFKMLLLRKDVDVKVFLPFALVAIPFAIFGAWLMGVLSDSQSISLSSNWSVKPLSMIVGLLMIAFTALDFWPAWNRIEWKGKLFYFGGVFSGFFGGLSGHQGALRSLFLKKLHLNPSAFVATGTAVAILIDLGRLPVYIGHWDLSIWPWKHILMATLSAMIGALLGKRLLKKVSIDQLHSLVGLFIVLTGIALIAGWI
jgi:uncharacterized membrane protein YfcA